MDDVATWSALRLAGAIRSREISSRELLKLYLDRIHRLNIDVNAVVTLDEERASAAAGEADAATARGDSIGPLHGLPVTIKDAIETAGLRSTGGAEALSQHVPTADAPAVAQLKAAGAIVFGKTNLPEWSRDVQTYNDLFGTTNNPWDPTLVPGGSSGGAAAAVACGFTSFELGTDIGGSVRIPAHCCGVFGLKPSFGLVSQRGYLDHAAGGTTDVDINVFGPLARSAADLDVLLDVLAGPAPEAAVAWRVALPERRGTSLADYRIGVWFDEPGQGAIESSYSAVLTDVVAKLADAGARIEPAHPPVDFTDQVALFFRLVGAAISPGLPAELAEVTAGSHLDWLQRDRERAWLRSVWSKWFETYDILLCPVSPTPAFPHQQEGDLLERQMIIEGSPRPYIDHSAWAGLIGVVGLPSAVPPIGRTAAGLPVGMQVVAPYLRDRDAIRIAALIAEIAGGYEPPPGF
jgi:amidase